MGWYRVLLVVGRYRVALWTGKDCWWHLDSTEWNCGLVQIVGGIRTVQNGIVGWYRGLVAVGRYRVALWVGTDFWWQ